MTDAPERIWLSHAGSAREYDVPISRVNKPIDYPGTVREYIRADLAPTDAQIMAHPKVRALVKALRGLLEAHESGWIAGEDWGAADRARAALKNMEPT